MLSICFYNNIDNKIIMGIKIILMPISVEVSWKIGRARKRKTNCATIQSFPGSVLLSNTALDLTEHKKLFSCDKKSAFWYKEALNLQYSKRWFLKCRWVNSEKKNSSKNGKKVFLLQVSDWKQQKTIVAYFSGEILTDVGKWPNQHSLLQKRLWLEDSGQGYYIRKNKVKVKS